MPRTSRGPPRTAAGGGGPAPVACTRRSTRIHQPGLQGGDRRGWKNRGIKTARRREGIKEVVPWDAQSFSPSACLGHQRVQSSHRLEDRRCCSALPWRAQSSPSAPPVRCWRVLGPWLLSQFPRWQPGCPGGGRRRGALQTRARAPRTAPRPGEVLMAVSGTVRKGDLDSYEKKGFSLSSCLGHQHRRRRSARQDLHQHVGACCAWGHRNPFWGKSEGDEGPRHPHAYVAPRPQSPCGGARVGHSRRAEKPNLATAEPAASQQLASSPGAWRWQDPQLCQPAFGGVG